MPLADPWGRHRQDFDVLLLPRTGPADEDVTVLFEEARAVTLPWGQRLLAEASAGTVGVARAALQDETLQDTSLLQAPDRAFQ